MSRPDHETSTAAESRDDRPAEDATEDRRERRTRAAVSWVRSGTGFSATIDGRDYRVTKYPAGSPMDAPYGAYAEGRFIGSGPTLESVKSRCTAHAGRLGMRSPSRVAT